MKSFLRRFVLASSAHPLFFRLYRALYRAVVAGFALWARTHPQVKALYVRGSFARGDYAPGRSDLDFVVVLRTGEQDSVRFAFLRRFRATFRGFRKLLPMLGEVEILSESHFPQWRARVLDRRHMRPVWGPSLSVESHPESEEKLTHALSDFVFLLLPNLSHWSPLERQRLAVKILRHCGADRQALSDCPFELAGQVLEALLKAGRTVSWPTDSCPGSLCQRPQREELPDWLRPWSEHLEAVLWSPYERGDCVVILKGRAPQGLLRSLCQNLSRPVLLDRATFRFYLNFVSPLQAISLMADRVLWGRDPMADFDLQEVCFERGMQRSAALVLSHVQTHEITPEQNQQTLLGWFLRVKRYLEDGARESYFHEILNHYQKADPALFRRIQKCLDHPDPCRDFSLYRRLSDDLNRALVF